MTVLKQKLLTIKRVVIRFAAAVALVALLAIFQNLAS